MYIDLTHGSLFTGIGGFDLGAEKSNIQTLWNCEIEKYQRKILKKTFPKTEQYDDIRNITNPRYVDIITGGFPCQDISIAGKGAGIDGEQSGLWSEMYRVLGIAKPRYAIIENSPALLIRGFERVLCDISKIGYNAEWQCLSNIQFGYPHKRERIYIIAYTNKIGSQSNVFKQDGFRSVFKQFTPNSANGYTLSKRIHQMPAHTTIRNGDGVSCWAQRVGSLGNSVNPTIAHYLFECIKTHINR